MTAADTDTDLGPMLRLSCVIVESSCSLLLSTAEVELDRGIVIAAADAAVAAMTTPCVVLHVGAITVVATVTAAVVVVVVDRSLCC